MGNGRLDCQDGESDREFLRYRVIFFLRPWAGFGRVPEETLVDATMNRGKAASIVAVVLSLAMIPVLWIVAFGAIPALAVVQSDQSGGRMGPWVFTWALVWLASLAALVVAWLCYVSLDDSAL
jgi:hypothetical protein